MQMLLFNGSCGWQSQFGAGLPPGGVGSSKSIRLQDPTREGLTQLQGNVIGGVA